MIDRIKRDQLALSLRRFLSGRLTLDQFWDQPPYGWLKDQAVADIVNELDEWSAERPGRATARELLNVAMYRSLTRAVAFLRTDQEYRWTLLDDLPRMPWPFDREHGNIDTWPFFSATDLRKALQRPTFLTGGLNGREHR